MPKIDINAEELVSDYSSVSDLTDDPAYSAPPRPVKGLERLTISDDRNAGSDLETRYLMALRDRTAPSKAPESARLVPVATSRPSDSDQGVERTRLQQRFGRLEFDAAIVSSTIPSGRQDSSVNATARGNLTKGVLESDMNEQPASADNHVRLEGRVATDMSDQSDSNGKLDAGIESLQERIRILQDEVDKLEIQKRKTSPKAYCILYRIHKEIYFDHPEWTDGNKAIVSRAPVKNLDLFLEKNKNVTFIVYRDFKGDPSSVKKSKLPQPKHTEESIRPVNKQLRKGIETFLQNNWRYKMILQDFYKTGEVQAPYFFIYHDRPYWASVLLDSTKRLRGHPAIVARYILQNYGSEYAAADALFSRGRISVNFVKYLCQPGDILVSRIGDQYRGLVATSWPLESGNSELRGKGDIFKPNPDDDRDNQWSHSGSDWNSESIEAEFYSFSKYDIGSILASDAVKDPTRRSSTTTLASMKFEIWVWEWGFDGAFKRVSEEVYLRLAQKTAKVALEDTEFNLCDLNVFPLRFASKSIVEGLRRRGEMFWACRKRCLVSYQEPSTEEQEEMSDERFMIDFLTFRKLHPENLSQTIRFPEETMSQAEMDEEQPPDEAFFYLVPLQTKGFNLRTKKWLDLNMDQIHPVVWNRKAFDTLVLDRKTKELITALVSKQISATKSTDVIAGKGNGLILLLHGGPGTGKTLTAEGVAEIAKKPLYRVTCGDVGTKAEEVESYLESVLHLGKIWDCVVLLDEAEVFLERRSLDDLQRNALVSVFLRVIEYHEGILILTSNRVGTFDEAFRSRIQIAVHYPPLRAYQRLQIWKNFFDRLESFKDGTVDVEELRDHLEDLQNIEINGRQIRNAITTARQYADWKGKVMNYEHLTTALEVAGKFDAYSEKLRGGLTDDQIAEEEGIR